MSRVTISSATVTTDAFSTLTIQSHGFTNGVLLITSNAKVTSSFRIKNQAGTVITPADISVPAGGTAAFSLTKLTPGSTTNYNLERLEYGNYVPQSSDPSNVNNMTSLTTDIMSMTVSTATVHANIAFNIPSTVTPVPEVVVLIQNKTDFDANTTGNMQLLNVPAATGATVVSIDGLTAATAYTAVLMTRDRSTPNSHYSDGFAENTIDMKNFTTSLSGNLSIGAVFCSYTTLTWTGDSNEMYRVIDTKGAIVAADGPPGTIMVSSLVPGTNYTFALQMKSGTTYQNVASATCTTPTTTVTIQGVTDSQCTASWTSVYDKAAYEVTVTSSASKSVVQTLDTSALTQVVKGLSPKNTYVIALMVIENNTATTVSRAALGTADLPSSTPASSASASEETDDSKSSPPSSYGGETDPGTNAASTEPNPEFGNTKSDGPSASSDYQVSSSKSSSSNSNSTQSFGGNGNVIAKVPEHVIELAQKANSVIVPGKVSHIEIAIVVALACVAGYGVYKVAHAQK